MAFFALKSIWKIPAPIEPCWFCLLDKENWPQWWPYVDRVEQLQPGDTNRGTGNVSRYYWHTCLPYRLIVDITVTEITPFKFIRFTADGDLKGYGSCTLEYRDRVTTLQFEWNVRTNKQWMNFIADVAAPIFIWNHQRVMVKGEQSFIQRLYSNR